MNIKSVAHFGRRFPITETQEEIMSYISMDIFSEVRGEDKNKPEKRDDGKYKIKAELRGRVNEGDDKNSYSISNWRQIVAARGNKFVINETYTNDKTKETIIGRSALLQSNGDGQDYLIVEKEGDPKRTYNFTTGLADAFALVCEQSEIAQRSAGR